MKITVAQYAKALDASLENKSDEDVKVVIANFLNVLKKNNQLKLMDKIMENFSSIYDKKNGIVSVQVTSVKELDEKTLAEVKKYVAQKYGAKEVILKNKIDKKIKGGIVFRVGDEMIDASVSRKLIELEKTLR